MADDSRNPADNYEMRKLRAELQGVVSELKAEVALAREQAAENGRAAQRQSRAAERESSARRNRTSGRVERVTGEVLPREEAAATRSTAGDQERITRARERGARAAQEAARAVERERLALPPGRAQALLGPGTPATTRYVAPYARPIPGTGGAYPYGLGGGGRGGGGLPPGPPPPAPPPPPGGRGRPTGGYVENERFNQSMRESVKIGSKYDDSLRRHGALTTEFFEALARGEVTLAELRYQLGATIAKFAGWTAASVLVFTALDAVRQLGKGAIDASAGVSTLQRYINDVDTGKAQQQFVDLAQQFNLPIADVADAMAQMGQVFHSQNAAFEASKAALYGVKVGQLSVADSTKYLLGIVRGFGLDSSELGPVFDRINQAQNKFGVGIRDTAAGVSKAAGVWHAAGGDVNYLTSLIVTGAAKTGRSGEEIGTALARSAEILKRGNTKNAVELQKYGISAADPVNKIYDKAFKLVREGKVRGAEITRLAVALSTPQLGGRISAILQDPASQTLGFDKVRRTLSDSGGSAARELEKTLRSAREQLNAIGTNLQTIGAEFVRAGGAKPFAAMLVALNGALRLTTDLLQLFNELPGPLHEAAIVGLELAAIMKLAGRFGFAPGRGGTPELRREAQQQVQFHKEQARFAEQDLNRARFNAGAAGSRLAQEPAGTTGYYSALAARERALEAVAEAEARLAYAETQLAGSVEARAAMNARGYVPGAPGVAPGGGRTSAAGAGRTAPLGVNLLPDAQRAEREAGRVRQQMNRMGGATRAAFNAVGGTFSGVTAGARNVGSRLGGLRGALSSLGGLMRGLLSDPLGAGFAAYIGADALKRHFESRGRDFDRFGAGPHNAAESRKILNTHDTSDAAQAAANTELEILQRQAAERNAGKPVTSLFTSQIRRQAADTLGLLKAHKITRDEAQRQLEVLEVELKSSRSSPQLIALARHDLKGYIAGVGPNSKQSVADILRGLDHKEFDQRLQDDAAAITNYGRRDQRLQEIAAGYRIALRRARRAPTTENIKSLTAAQAAVDAVIADSQKRLDAELAGAVTLAQRESAYNANRSRLARLPRSQPRSQALRANEVKRFEDELASFDARTALGESRIADPAARGRYTLSRMNARIARLRAAVRNGTKNEEDLWAAEAQRSDQLQQIEQDQLAEFQSRQALAASRFALSVHGAQGPTLQFAIGQARAAVANARQHGKKGDVRDALKGLADAELALDQYVRDQASALLQAEEAYREAGIDPGNTLAIARLQERFARRDQRENPALDPAGRREQQARTRAAHHATLRARQQERYDQISFEADIGRITHDQEIRQLQALLKTIHGNRELRRQVQRQIYALKHEGDQAAGFDLNVGNIKLPTVYEIRRAIKGGAGPSQGQVQVQNNNRIDVHVSSEADVDAVFSRIDDYTGAGLRSAGRAAGLR